MDFTGPVHETAGPEEVQSLREENRSLRLDFEACKSQLIELLHEDKQISDAAIKKNYLGICEGIEAWTDYVMADANDGLKRFYSEVMRYDGDAFRNDRRLPRIKDLGLSPALKLQTLGNDDSFDYLFLSCLVIRQLNIHIFHRQNPVGITKSQSNFIKEVEQSMGRDSLGKEQLSMNKWRSETLTALVAHENFKKSQADSSARIFKNVKRAISPWLPGRDTFRVREARFRQDIFDPAIKFHQDLRASTHRYWIRDYPLQPGIVPALVIDESWELKDIGTWGKVRRNDNIAGVLQCLYPAIVRPGIGNEEHLILVKAVIVVRLEEAQAPKCTEIAKYSPILEESRKMDWRNAEPQRVEPEEVGPQRPDPRNEPTRALMRLGGRLVDSIFKFKAGGQTRARGRRSHGTDSSAGSFTFRRFRTG